MSVRDAITQAVRAWLKTSAALTDAQCIVADRDGPRPPLPYLTVKVLVSDDPVGMDEPIDGTVGDDAVRYVVGERRATVSIQGFGEQTSEWLEQAHIGLGRDAIKALLTSHGVTIVPMGGASNLSAFLNTGTQPRYLFEVEAYYRLTTPPDTVIELAPNGAVVDLEFKS